MITDADAKEFLKKLNQQKDLSPVDVTDGYANRFQPWDYFQSENLFCIKLSTLRDKYMMMVDSPKGSTYIKNPAGIKCKQPKLYGKDFKYLSKPEEFGIMNRPCWVYVEEDFESEFSERRIFIMDE